MGKGSGLKDPACSVIGYSLLYAVGEKQLQIFRLCGASLKSWPPDQDTAGSS
jgi:hypothetical protein